MSKLTVYLPLHHESQVLYIISSARLLDTWSKKLGVSKKYAN